MLKGISSKLFHRDSSATTTAGTYSGGSSDTPNAGPLTTVLKHYEVFGHVQPLVGGGPGAQTTDSSSGSECPFVCGHHQLWQVFPGREKAEPRRPVSVFVCFLHEVNERCASSGSDVSAKDASKRVIERLKAGPNTLAKVRHPHMLQLMAPLGEEGHGNSKRLVFVTERVVGTLHGAITSLSGAGRSATAVGATFDFVECLSRLHRLTLTLRFLHQQANFIVTDLNPESIFVTTDGQWKVGDLTFAVPTAKGSGGEEQQLQGSAVAQVSRSALPQFKLSPSSGRWQVPLEIPQIDYIAPEVVSVVSGGLDPMANGGRAQEAADYVTAQCDVFSLGCVVYDVLTVCHHLLTTTAEGKGSPYRHKTLVRSTGELGTYFRYVNDIPSLLTAGLGQSDLFGTANSEKDRTQGRIKQVLQHLSAWFDLRPSLRPTIDQLAELTVTSSSTSASSGGGIGTANIFLASEVRMLQQLEDLSCLDSSTRFTVMKGLYGSVGQLSEHVLATMVVPALMRARTIDSASFDPLIVPLFVEMIKKKPALQPNYQTLVAEANAAVATKEKTIHKGESRSHHQDAIATAVIDESAVPLARLLFSIFVEEFFSSKSPLDQKAKLHLVRSMGLLRPLLLLGCVLDGLRFQGLVAAVEFLGSILENGSREFLPVTPPPQQEKRQGKKAAETPPPPPAAVVRSDSSSSSVALLSPCLQEIGEWVDLLPFVGRDSVWSPKVLVPLVKLSNPSPILEGQLAQRMSIGASQETMLDVIYQGLATCVAVSVTLAPNEASVLLCRIPSWIHANLQLGVQGFLDDATLEQRLTPLVSLAEKLLPRAPMAAITGKYLPCLAPLLATEHVKFREVVVARLMRGAIDQCIASGREAAATLDAASSSSLPSAMQASEQTVPPTGREEPAHEGCDFFATEEAKPSPSPSSAPTTVTNFSNAPSASVADVFGF